MSIFPGIQKIYEKAGASRRDTPANKTKLLDHLPLVRRQQVTPRDVFDHGQLAVSDEPIKLDLVSQGPFDSLSTEVVKPFLSQPTHRELLAFDVVDKRHLTFSSIQEKRHGRTTDYDNGRNLLHAKHRRQDFSKFVDIIRSDLHQMRINHRSHHLQE